MFQNIIILVGLMGFLEALFIKFSVWTKLEFIGSKSKYKLIYKLLSCRFCFKFHISWIIYALLVFLGFLKDFNLLVLLSVNGLIFYSKNNVI